MLTTFPDVLEMFYNNLGQQLNSIDLKKKIKLHPYTTIKNLLVFIPIFMNSKKLKLKKLFAYYFTLAQFVLFMPIGTPAFGYTEFGILTQTQTI